MRVEIYMKTYMRMEEWYWMEAWRNGMGWRHKYRDTDTVMDM